MSPSWPQTSRSAWPTLVDQSPQPPLGNDPAGSSDPQQESEPRPPETIETAGPAGGAAPGPPPATRQRVVLLPTPGPNPLTADPPTAAQEGPPA
jgi:hypothetical protein